MKGFMFSVNLKKATLLYLATKMQESYFDELRKAFLSVDVNGDGKIEKHEF